MIQRLEHRLDDKEDPPNSAERSLLVAVSVIFVTVVLIALSRFMWGVGSALIEMLNVITPQQ